MKKFDLQNLKITTLNNIKLEELKEYLTTLPSKNVEDFIGTVLDEFSLGDNNRKNKKISKFLNDEQFLNIRKKFLGVPEDEGVVEYYQRLNEEEKNLPLGKRKQRAKKQDKELIKNSWKLR